METDEETTEQIDVPILYLDIGGTVRSGGRYGPEEVRVYPEATKLIVNWKKGGGRVVGVSNQAGVGTGRLSQFVMHAAMKETNRQTGDLFDRIMICPHAPRDKCECRKPGTWMVTKAVLELMKKYPGEKYPTELALFVGDSRVDRECAAACGIDFMDAEAWRAQISEDV